MLFELSISSISFVLFMLLMLLVLFILSLLFIFFILFIFFREIIHLSSYVFNHLFIYGFYFRIYAFYI